MKAEMEKSEEMKRKYAQQTHFLKLLLNSAFGKVHSFYKTSEKNRDLSMFMIFLFYRILSTEEGKMAHLPDFRSVFPA